MVDVHAWISAATFGYQVQEGGQGFALAVAIVGPNRPELLISGSVVLKHAKEVFQPPLHAVCRPEWIALEVEKDVARVGCRHRTQRNRVGHLELWCTTLALAHLQLRLCHQLLQTARRQIGYRLDTCGQFCDGADSGLQQCGTLTDPHARDK